jgi:hypothetical protein
VVRPEAVLVDPLAECREAGECCPRDRVFFSGVCRSATFFERFLSEDAVLAGVAGPTDMSTDTGAIVLETLAGATVQRLYVLPLPDDGQPRPLDAQYRANYPVVAIETDTTFVDEHGHVTSVSMVQQGVTVLNGVFAEPRFGVDYWVRTTYVTSSRTRWVDSDGVVSETIAGSDGSGTNYCVAAADGVEDSVRSGCLAQSARAVYVPTVSAGAAVFLTVTPLSPAAGFAGMVVVQQSMADAGAAVADSVCTDLSEHLANAAENLCDWSSPPDPLPDVTLPFLPTWVSQPSGNQPCEGGMIRYSGQVTLCSETSHNTSGSYGIETVSVEVACDIVTVSNLCVIP